MATLISRCRRMLCCCCPNKCGRSKNYEASPAEEPLTKGAEDIETVEATPKIEATPKDETETPVVVTLKEEAETLKKEETPKEITPKEETPKEETPKEETPTEEMSCIHQKARQQTYQGAPEEIVRFEIKDEEVDWKVELPAYSPVVYTDAKIISEKPVWADSDVLGEDFDKINFNSMDGQINRVSYHGNYDFEDLEGKNVPRNPMGRTGMKGRGLLGKWGPNHAADPIVSRFKRDSEGKVEKNEDKPILEFVAIQRKDTKEWAIPGGMVDGGEHVSATLKREFGEEALNSLEDEQKEETRKLMEDFFKAGTKIYEGYVDDPRNTDNAWMESSVYSFHDEDGKKAGRIPLNAGDDAQAVQWLAIHSGIELYASHKEFIHKVCERLGAYF